MVETELKFDENFLKEEVKNDFFVDKKRKELWAVQLDLLNKLINVCDKYELKVIADAGTLLGCVRHKGFIPWDDDIDVLMFRDDYEKLCSIAKDEFKGDYFFQNMYTDNIVRAHSQLRRTNTTQLTRNDYNARYNCGIFIDIFVLDYIPDDKKEQINFYKKLEKKFNKVKIYSYKGIDLHSGLSKYIRIIYNNFLKFFDKLIPNYLKKMQLKKYKEFEIECSKYKGKSSTVANISFFSSLKNPNFFAQKLDNYKNLSLYSFEMLKIYGASNFDEVLKNQYGDYMKFVIGNTMHGNLYYNCNEPYKKFINISYDEFNKLFE